MTTIAWRGEVVAWADAGQVRVMNITSQAAICYLNSPPNVGPSNPFPCHLFWESEYVSVGRCFSNFHAGSSGRLG